MKRTIKSANFFDTDILYYCEDLSESMRNIILENAYIYESFEPDNGRVNEIFSFKTKEGHLLAEINVIYSDSGKFKYSLEHFSKPSRGTAYWSEICDRWKQLEEERVSDLKKAIDILSETMNPRYFERTKNLAYYVNLYESETFNSCDLYTKDFKKIISFKNRFNGPYEITDIKSDFFRDLK